MFSLFVVCDGKFMSVVDFEYFVVLEWVYMLECAWFFIVFNFVFCECVEGVFECFLDVEV